MKIGIVIGSIRDGRNGKAIGDWVAARAAERTDAEFVTVDLKEFDLPLMASATLPAMADRKYESDNVSRWSRVIDSCDGFVFVTPEYNHSIPAALKNALDYLFAEWHHKPAGIVSYGLAGGVRAAEHLKTVLLEVKAVPVSAQVALSVFEDFTYADPTDPASPFEVTPRDHQATALSEMIAEVLAYTTALATLRSPTGTPTDTEGAPAALAEAS